MNLTNDNFPMVEHGAEGTVAAAVTLCNWTLMADGKRYIHVWCRNWMMVTDGILGKAIGVEGFRSTERWQLLGIGLGGKVAAVIPGCQVKALVLCATCPPPMSDTSRAYNLTVQCESK